MNSHREVWLARKEDGLMVINGEGRQLSSLVASVCGQDSSGMGVQRSTFRWGKSEDSLMATFQERQGKVGVTLLPQLSQLQGVIVGLSSSEGLHLPPCLLLASPFHLHWLVPSFCSSLSLHLKTNAKGQALSLTVFVHIRTHIYVNMSIYIYIFPNRFSLGFGINYF